MVRAVPQREAARQEVKDVVRAVLLAGSGDVGAMRAAIVRAASSHSSQLHLARALRGADGKARASVAADVECMQALNGCRAAFHHPSMFGGWPVVQLGLGLHFSVCAELHCSSFFLSCQGGREAGRSCCCHCRCRRELWEMLTAFQVAPHVAAFCAMLLQLAGGERG